MSEDVIRQLDPILAKQKELESWIAFLNEEYNIRLNLKNEKLSELKQMKSQLNNRYMIKIFSCFTCSYCHNYNADPSTMAEFYVERLKSSQVFLQTLFENVAQLCKNINMLVKLWSEVLIDITGLIRLKYRPRNCTSSIWELIKIHFFRDHFWSLRALLLIEHRLFVISSRIAISENYRKYQIFKEKISIVKTGDRVMKIFQNINKVKLS